MNPTTSSTETQFSPCSIGNICSLLGTRTTSDSCLVDPGSRTTIALQQCGNGIVDRNDGEECDPGFNSTSTCCDPETCRFREGAACDPQNDACCTDTCQIASQGTVCRAARDGTCDYEEVCDGSSDTCPEDRTADDGVDCGNGLQCASGICTSLNQQCRQSGNSMNLTEACGQKNDQSCVVSCRDPDNRSVAFPTPMQTVADTHTVINVWYSKLHWWMDHHVDTVVIVTTPLVKLVHGKIDSRKCILRTSKFRSQ